MAPFHTDYVDPDVFLTHKGVTVFHVYKDDDYDNGAREYWFSTSPRAEEGQPGEFDVRELSTAVPDPPYPKGVDYDPKPGSPWEKFYRERKQRQREAIRAAIDTGEIKPWVEEE